MDMTSNGKKVEINQIDCSFSTIFSFFFFPDVILSNRFFYPSFFFATFPSTVFLLVWQ